MSILKSCKRIRKRKVDYTDSEGREKGENRKVVSQDGKKGGSCSYGKCSKPEVVVQSHLINHMPHYKEHNYDWSYEVVQINVTEL